MNYDGIIDAETWAFIRATEAHNPPAAEPLTVAEQRARYDALCEAFDAGRPEGVTVEDGTVSTVPIRTYAPADKTGATVLFAHGGGFVLGGLDSHDSICAELAARTGCTVIAVDYRLAPEHKHPAAYDDVLAVAGFLAESGNPLVLAGDSAGATLVAAVAHTIRSGIAGQVLIYPYLGGDMNSGSYITHADAPLLSRADMLFFEDIRIEGPAPKGDPRFAPLEDATFENLPASVVFTAACDPLCDDGRVYCDRVNAAGGRARLVDEPGLVHGYLRARHSVARARDSFDRIVAAVRELAGSSD